MTDDPMIYKEVLEPYFQSMSHSDERYSVKVELSSDENRVTFKVQFEILEPGFTASFPQQEYILEKHRGRGHEGIHFQMKYHPVDEETGTARIYVIIEVESDEELLSIAQGFIYILYEIMSDMGEDMRSIAGKIFNLENVVTLKEKKGRTIAKISESFESRGIEVHDRKGLVMVVRDNWELRRIVRARRELLPLLGPIISD